MTAVIGVDVGGSKVAAGVVDEHGGLTAATRRDTPSADPEETGRVIADLVGDLSRTHDAVAVGIGAPGLIDADRTTVVHTPNLAWRDFPLGTLVEQHTGLPVVVENDANAAAWAEARFGAGRGQRCTVVLTVGTGLGGGLVIDGQLYRGCLGMAGEQNLAGWRRGTVPDVQPAGLGPEAGIIGAADLARHR